jgi:hypothetical protein
MANVAAPYGLRPINLMGGQANSGSVRQYKIASAYGTSIFYGDLVQLVQGGTLEKFTGTTAVATFAPVGVFLGVAYTDPASKQFWTRNMWTASTAADDAMAYVCDDPDMLFEIQADESVAQEGLGTNAALVQNAGNTATGMSRVALDGDSIATTATHPHCGLRSQAGVQRGWRQLH